MPDAALDPWMRDPDEIERFFHAALKARDFQSVEGAIRLMLVADPRRGIGLYDALTLCLAIVTAGDPEPFNPVVAAAFTPDPGEGR